VAAGHRPRRHCTQIVVERQLEAGGVDRKTIGRQKFIEHVWDWKAYSGGAILGQMKRLGDSVDWGRTYFTMDDRLSKVVIETFVQLYEQGLIYRGQRLVNWDPKLQTAVSDLEVETRRKKAASGRSTTRRGRRAGRGGGHDASGDPARRRRGGGASGRRALCGAGRAGRSACRFATGRSGHRPTRWSNREFRHRLREDHPGARLQRLRGRPAACAGADPDLHCTATVNDNATARYRGMDAYVARKSVLEDLRAAGLLVSEKPHRMMVPRCGRTGEAVEPMLSDQWYVAMSKPAPAGHAASGQVAGAGGRSRRSSPAR